MKVNFVIGTSFGFSEYLLMIDSDILGRDEWIRETFPLEMDGKRGDRYLPMWSRQMSIEDAKKLRDVLDRIIIESGE